MTNLIGQDVNNMSLYEDQNYILHIYGKKNQWEGLPENKAGRVCHYGENHTKITAQN